MREPSSFPALAAVAVCVLAVLAATALVARREVTVRVARDREPLRQFATRWQRETQRLERLYEGHLRRLARTAPLPDRTATVAVASRLVGVRQFSVLHRAADRTLDVHWPTEAMAGPALPQPAFVEATTEGLPQPQLLLPENTLLGNEETSGWVDDPGRPLCFWQRRTGEECVVLLLDAPALVAEMNAWLDPWLAREFPAAQRAGDRAVSPDTRLEPPPGFAAQPDFLLPIHARTGTWLLASWDEVHPHVLYLPGVVAAGCSLAGLLLVGGIFLVRQQRRAWRLARERVSFVNAVSHELRAPLTNILLNVELAREVETPHPGLDRLGFVEEEARRLVRLVDNVLTFARRSRPPVLRTAVRPADLVAGVVAQFRPLLERRDLRLRVEEHPAPPCWLEADTLVQVVANLLSNLEKHAGPGQAVLSLQWRAARLTLTLQDEGPGVPPAAREHIFQPFVQGHGRTASAASGAGLGLAISRELAARLNGTLSLAPSPRGCRFVLEVPAPEAVQAA